ncbi:hypothetical protein PJO48_29640, partial [Mycobacterium kansasii]
MSYDQSWSVYDQSWKSLRLVLRPVVELRLELQQPIFGSYDRSKVTYDQSKESLDRSKTTLDQSKDS